MAKIRKYLFWTSENPNYPKCKKILHKVAREYLQMALDRLDEYRFNECTYLKARTLSEIPGCYDLYTLLAYAGEMKYETIDWKNSCMMYIFEINSVKEWLKRRYKDARKDLIKYPNEVYNVARKRCEEMELG